MRFLIYLIVFVLISSCSNQYNIAGNSNVSFFDGRMLYLKVAGEDAYAINVDSCQVIHGRFDFYGNVDSVVLAQLCMEDEKIMPVVLERGNLVVEVDHSGQSVAGGPYNERLYKFLKKKNRIEHEQWELDQKFLQLMQEGKSMDEIQKKLGEKSHKLSKEMEDLETKFILENCDNPLGPGYFMMLFGQYPLPLMTEQLKNIINLAPSDFFNDPFVDKFIRKAKLREADSLKKK